MYYMNYNTLVCEPDWTILPAGSRQRRQESRCVDNVGTGSHVTDGSEDVQVSAPVRLCALCLF